MGELEVARSDLEVLRGELVRQTEAETTALARRVAMDLLAQGRASMTIVEPVNFARPFVHAGEWVAECPGGCRNAEFVTGKDPRRRGVAGTRGERYEVFVCSYCNFRCPISWPTDADEIMTVLDRRPIVHSRNWFPSGHPLATVTGIPTGQSVADLLAENAEHGVN